MPRENLDDLAAFLAAARERSFTRAAARLGVSQSALSQTVRAWTEVQRLFPAEISRPTCPQVDGGSSEEQGCGCRPSPCGEYRYNSPHVQIRPSRHPH
jgi:hypothetical protein